MPPGVTKKYKKKKRKRIPEQKHTYVNVLVFFSLLSPFVSVWLNFLGCDAYKLGWGPHKF